MRSFTPWSVWCFCLRHLGCWQTSCTPASQVPQTKTPDRPGSKRSHRRLREPAQSSGGRVARPVAVADPWTVPSDASYPPETETTGCRSEARATLSEIYGWFTEGFDTADPEGRQG